MGVLLGHRKKLLKAIAQLPRRADAQAGDARQPEDEVIAGGERRQVTVLFADLSGFSKLASELDAEEVHVLLNRYFTLLDEIIEGFGGGLLFGGAANALVIGDGDLEWDWVGIMRYPSFEAFINMTQSEEYQKIHVHRDAGLEHQVLINCLDLPQSLSALQAATQ